MMNPSHGIDVSDRCITHNDIVVIDGERIQSRRSRIGEFDHNSHVLFMQGGLKALGKRLAIFIDDE